MVSTAVVIVTYRRPHEVRRCLDAIDRQTLQPDEVVVVDASPDSLTASVVSARPDVTYLRNEAGLGTMSTSRAIGFRMTSSDVVAYVDDDAVPHPDWLEKIVEPYRNPLVGAVGGRVINSVEEVAAADPTRIGLLLADGQLTGNFAADPGADVEVVHLLGANMSYRRSAIEAIGGIHEYYPGTCYREDSDLGLRMSLAGLIVVFAHAASVDHISGKYAKGKRFDRRYQYYAERNHVVLLGSLFGLSHPLVRRYFTNAVEEIKAELRNGLSRAWRGSSHGGRTMAASWVRAVTKGLGLLGGFSTAVILRVKLGPPPKPRTDLQAMVSD